MENYGFVKAAAGSVDIRVADCEYNAAAVIKAVHLAEKKGVRLIVFPELCITGYTCGDLFYQKTLLDGALKGIKDILEDTAAAEVISVVGAPFAAFGSLFNCAFVLYRGRVLGIVPKVNIPNYAEYYEMRQFVPGTFENVEIELWGQKVPFGSKLIFRCREFEDFSFAIEICEDLWVPESPSLSHAVAGAAIIVNPSAGDETIGKAEYRRMMVRAASGKLLCGYVYAGAGDGESTGDMVFSGHSMICENGVMLSETELFENGFAAADIDVERLLSERRKMNTFVPAAAGYAEVLFDMDVDCRHFDRVVAKMPFVPSGKSDKDKVCGEILRMQAWGLKKRVLHTGCRTCVVGISGGLDSALALLVTVEAMDILKRPRTDIIAVTMPCFGTTGRTKSNAQLLCEALGVTFREVNITDTVLSHFNDIGQSSDDYSVTFENSQARERTQVLMDIANMTGGIVIGTGDLSELALGWATYNGDHMSMYGVNGSVPKTLVRHLVEYYGGKSESDGVKNALFDILDTPVSPELLPAENGEISQRTEDLVGPYELHDFFLYYIVRFGFAPDKVFFLANRAFAGVYDRETIKKWLVTFLRRFFSQQFKRSCLPDGPKVGSVTLSPRGDWRMPSDASAALWLNIAEKL